MLNLGFPPALSWVSSIPRRLTVFLGLGILVTCIGLPHFIYRRAAIISTFASRFCCSGSPPLFCWLSLKGRDNEHREPLQQRRGLSQNSKRGFRQAGLRQGTFFSWQSLLSCQLAYELGFFIATLKTRSRTSCKGIANVELYRTHETNSVSQRTSSQTRSAKKVRTRLRGLVPPISQ